MQTGLYEYDQEAVEDHDVPVPEKPLQRQNQKRLTVPEKKEAQDHVAHAENAYAARARYKHDGEHNPVGVHEHKELDLVQVGLRLCDEVKEGIVLVDEPIGLLVDQFAVAARRLVDLLAPLQMENGELKPSEEDLKEVRDQIA